MRIFLFTILMLFLGQLSFNCVLSFAGDEDEITLNAEESEDGEGEGKVEFEKETAPALSNHGSPEPCFNIEYLDDQKLVNKYQVTSYPKICVTAPYSPPDRNC